MTQSLEGGDLMGIPVQRIPVPQVEAWLVPAHPRVLEGSTDLENVSLKDTAAVLQEERGSS